MPCVPPLWPTGLASGACRVFVLSLRGPGARKPLEQAFRSIGWVAPRVLTRGADLWVWLCGVRTCVPRVARCVPSSCEDCELRCHLWHPPTGIPGIPQPNR